MIDSKYYKDLTVTKPMLTKTDLEEMFVLFPRMPEGTFSKLLQIEEREEQIELTV